MTIALKSDKYRLQIIERTLQTLFAFSADTPRHSLDSLAASTGINKTSLLRILRTLEPAGFLVREEEHYRLGSRVLDLANVYISTLSFHKVAQRHMVSLANSCRQTVSLAVFDGRDVVYVAVERAQQDIGIQGEIGGRHPVHATALGKVLLGALPRSRLEQLLTGQPLERLTHRTVVDPAELLHLVDCARQNGYAIDDEERAMGIRCVAAPIFDFRGQIVAAMSVAGPIFSMGEETLATIRDALLETVHDISHELGWRLVERDSCPPDAAHLVDSAQRAVSNDDEPPASVASRRLLTSQREE